jgi:hypothetical protein
MHPREFEQVIAQWNGDHKEQRASASPKAETYTYLHISPS